MANRDTATRLQTIRDLVMQAEAEAAALFIRDARKRKALRRVMAGLAAVRNEIDGAAE